MFICIALAIVAHSYHFVTVGSGENIELATESVMNSLDSHNSWTHYSLLSDLQEEIEGDVDLIFAYGLNEVNLTELIRFAEDRKILTLVFDSGTSSDFVIFLENPPQCSAAVIKNFLDFEKIERIGIVDPYSKKNQQVYEIFSAQSLAEISHIYINNGSSLKEVSKFLIKIFKSGGIQNFLVFPDFSLCSLVSEAFSDSRIDKVGSLGVFLDECIYQTDINGTVFLVQPGLEFVNSKVEYLTKKLIPFFSIFNKPHKSLFQLSKDLRERTGICEYSVVNIVGGIRKVVGTINEKRASINETIYYYGEINDRSEFLKARIVISANTGTFNPLGASPTFANKKYHEGTYFAIEKINRDHLFPNHNYYLYDKVDCGVNVFDYNYSKSCILKHIPHMGNAYIPTVTFINANFLSLLYQLEIKIPFVAGVLSAAPLSNQTVYPTFIRIVSPASLFSRAWANLITTFGWKKIVMHYANDSFGIAAYTTLNNSAKLQGYEIINDEKYRMINNILDNSTLPKYYEHMKNTISLGCNIIFLGMGDPTAFFWLEGMYDMGARRGDYTFIFFTTTGLGAFYQPTGNSTKRKELMHGSLVMYNAEWVGEYGQRVKKEFLNYRNETWGRSYCIDAVYTTAKTNEFLLAQGKSYEDNQIFNEAMRNIRFQGVTGAVSFDSSSNDRNLYFFNIFNFYEDSNNTWHDDAVSLISPLGTVYYETINPITWSNGEKPLDMKENYKNCKFREDQIRQSENSKTVKISLSVFLLLLASFFSVCILRKIRMIKIEMISQKSYAIFQDYLTFGFIFIESSQIISVGPSFEEFNETLSKICEAISLNYIKIEFWIVFLSLFIVTMCWLLMLLMIFFRLHCGVKSIARNLELLKEISLPVMSNYLFIPIISSLYTILMCDNSTGNDLTDAYLNYDCNMKCWKSSHLIFVAFASILIVSYVPIAIYYRTIWQFEDKLLNIRVNATYLVFKNINVLTLIVIAKVLKEDYALIHSIIFIILQLAIVVFLFFLKNPFNYDRANLWCKTLAICVVWNTFVCILSNSIFKNQVYLVILQMVGWVVILTAAIFIQIRLPNNLLVTKKGIDIKELFKFEFGLKSVHETIYAYRNRELPDEVDQDNK